MKQTSSPSRKKNRLEMFLYKEGMFYITINVHDHTYVFGEVADEEMKLNQYGKMVEGCRYDLPNHYSNCELFDFIIMPNHIHGIISVGEGFKPSLTKKHGLSEMIRGFKTFSSRKIHEAGLKDFKRQRSFYDHIVRNEEDLKRIQEYIEINPYKWKNDEYYR